MAACTRISGKNGAWRQTRAHSARRNGSTWNSRKTTAGFWWNGPSRYMTDDTSEKGTVTPKKIQKSLPSCERPASAIVRLRKTHCTACGTCTTGIAFNGGSESRLLMPVGRAPDVARGPSALKSGLSACPPPFAHRFGHNLPVHPVLLKQRSCEAESGGRGGNYFPRMPFLPFLPFLPFPLPGRDRGRRGVVHRGGAPRGAGIKAGKA